MGQISNRDWRCPYYWCASWRRPSISGECGQREFETAAELYAFADRYCSTDWESCPEAQVLAEIYEALEDD